MIQIASPPPATPHDPSAAAPNSVSVSDSATLPSSGTPDSPITPDLTRLGDEIAELAAHLDAARYRMLERLRHFDEREGWTGFRSCAHWLSWRTSLAPGAAREQVRVARALGGLSVLSAEMRAGRLSYSKARALTRVATPANEAELVEFARHATAAQVERVVRGWREVDRNLEREAEEIRHRHRHLTLFPDDDGSWVVRGRLDPEVGAVFQQALRLAEEMLFARTDSEPGTDPEADERPTWEQRAADALGIVADAALGDGFELSPADAAPGSADASPRRRAQPNRSAARRADRFQVVLHVTPDDLRSEPTEPTEPAELTKQPATAQPPRLLGDRGRVSAETCRRISCDASLVEMERVGHPASASSPRANVLDVGRKRRTTPPALRRALEARDAGCRFPGCAVETRWCDAHHVHHWADGGETRMDNLMLLCSFHHRAVHEEGLRVTLDPGGEARFHRPDGRSIPTLPPQPKLPGDPVTALRTAHRAMGITPTPWTSTPDALGDILDLDLAVMGLRGVG